MSSRNSPPASARLAIVAPSAYLLGGVQAWLDYLVPGLVEKGWPVTVLLVHGHCNDAHLYLEAHPFPNVRFVENPSGSREGRVRAIAQALREVGATLVMGVNIVDVYEAAGRLRQDGIGVKSVMALHGFNSALYEDLSRARTSLAGVIATNRLGVAAATELADMPAERAFYAPCGVPVPGHLRTDEPGPRLELLFAGRFDQSEKRVMDLPRILKALDDQGVGFRLRLAGAGPDEDVMRESMRPFGSNVEFLGVLGEHAMRSTFYVPGSILLIMSPMESGPLVAWEAMAQGTVVVSSRFIGMGMESGLRDGENCLVFPLGDTEAAAAAIVRLGDANLRARLAENARQLVLQRYLCSRSVDAWDSALRQIAASAFVPSEESPPTTASSGRLERLFGAAMAESLRRVVGRRYRHSSPGNEWPHTHGVEGNPDFFRKLAVMDGCP